MDRKISLKYGLIAGGIVVLYFLLFYFLDKESMLKVWVAYSSILIYAVFMAKTVSDQRELMKGIISFRDAISVAFLTFIIANIVYYIFYFFIIKSDLELLEMLRQSTIDFYKKMGQEAAEIENNFEVGFSTILLSFARGAIGGFILSLLIAGTMRRGKRRKAEGQIDRKLD